MKIVITDAQTVFDSEVTSEPLKRLGEVKEYGLLRYEEVAEAIADADIVLCNKTLLDSHTLRLAERLRFIGLFATGYNNIDIGYCKSRGIAVCNAGSYSTNAVAQHTFALILAFFSRTAEYGEYVKDGRWKRSKTFSPFVYPLRELAGKTLGIVGLGSIGTAVAKIANAFELRVLGFNRSPKNVDGVESVGIDTLLAESDIVSVHCPLNSDSKGLFGAEAFAKMKNTALFVNTARGGIVDEQALFDALKGGVIGGACLDTLTVEPMEEDCALMNAKNCLITPHIAWAPAETRRRLMDIVISNIEAFQNGTPKNLVS